MKFPILIGALAETTSPLPADDLYLTDWAFRELQEAIAENRQSEETADPDDKQSHSI